MFKRYTSRTTSKDIVKHQIKSVIKEQITSRKMNTLVCKVRQSDHMIALIITNSECPL